MKHDKEVDRAIEDKFGRKQLHDVKQKKKDYWQTVSFNTEGDAIENPRANPDRLSDECRILPESAEAYEQQRAIHDAKEQAIREADLTPRQRRLLGLVAQGYRQGEIAQKLGIAQPGVAKLLARARAQIKKAYNATRHKSGFDE